jgi:hypothetical protein
VQSRYLTNARHLSARKCHEALVICADRGLRASRDHRRGCATPLSHLRLSCVRSRRNRLAMHAAHGASTMRGGAGMERRRQGSTRACGLTSHGASPGRSSGPRARDVIGCTRGWRRANAFGQEWRLECGDETRRRTSGRRRTSHGVVNGGADRSTREAVSAGEPSTDDKRDSHLE